MLAGGLTKAKSKHTLDLGTGVGREPGARAGMTIYKTDEEVEDLLNHKNNGLRKIGVEVKIIGSGNNGKQGNSSKRSRELTVDDKAEVATLAHLIGNKATQEILGMDKAQVSQYKAGRNSSAVVEPELIAETERRIGKVSDKALGKVEQLLEIFAEDRMLELKAGEIPSAMERMSGVFDRISKHNGRNGTGISKPNVIIYAPKQINIHEYPNKEV